MTKPSTGLTPAPKSPEQRLYLTIIPNRQPREKTHVTVGHAKNAVQNRVYNGSTYVDIAVYEWVDNGWKLLWDIPKGTRVLPWKET